MPTAVYMIVPPLALIAVYGIIVIVALLQARPEDIPAIIKESLGTFRRVADRLPKIRATVESHDSRLHVEGGQEVDDA